MRLFLRIFFTACGGLALLVLGYVGWLGYRVATGESAWRAWTVERIAKGDHFDWQPLLPPQVSDEENFAKAPIVAGAIVGEHSDPAFRALDFGKGALPTMNGWREGQRVDFSKLATALQTKDLHTALDEHANALSELREASKRPACRIPVAYEEIEIPKLLGFRVANRVLQSRAILQLQQGRHVEALQDVLAGLRMAAHFRREPQLVPNLLHQALVGSSMQAVWEGLVDRAWTDEDLRIIQRQLAEVDLLASNRLAWEGERLGPVLMFTAMAEGTPVPRGMRDSNETDKLTQAQRRRSKGWFYLNLLEIDRYYATCFLDAIEPARHLVHPVAVDKADGWLKSKWIHPELLLAKIAISAFTGQIANVAERQARVDMAMVACGLERHRLATGRYPDTLEELGRAFCPRIPNDVISGGPIHYRKSGDTFQLYEVGWDGKDDGGQPAPKRKEGEATPKGDWVWFATEQK